MYCLCYSCDNEINDFVPNSNIIYKFFSLNFPKSGSVNLNTDATVYIETIKAIIIKF